MRRGDEQSLPMGEEASQGVLLDGLNFAAQPGQGLAPDLAQDFRVAPLAMQSAGTESSFEDSALQRELAQHIFDGGRSSAKRSATSC